MQRTHSLFCFGAISKESLIISSVNCLEAKREMGLGLLVFVDHLLLLRFQIKWCHSWEEMSFLTS